jgi:hypothetical protein
VPSLPAIDPAAIEKALMAGDISKLSAEVRVQYYRALCASCGLNPLTRPFIVLKTQGGELHWYATVGAAEQLRKLHHVSTRILSRDRTPDDLYIVTVQCSTPDGRQEESQGIEYVGGLKGQALGNSMMKAASKSLRRATLALCGLGLTLGDDEPGQVVPFDAQTGALALPDAQPGAAETLLQAVGQWFRSQGKAHREAIARAVWGVQLQEMPHLGYEELQRGWQLIEAGKAPLAWDSPTLADDMQQWRGIHAARAVLDVFDRSDGRPEED